MTQVQRLYDRVIVPAKAEFDRVTAPSLAEYKRVTAPAKAELVKTGWVDRSGEMRSHRTVHRDPRILESQAEFDRVPAPAWAEYQRVTAPAKAEYERAIVPAQAKYDRAKSEALDWSQRAIDQGLTNEQVETYIWMASAKAVYQRAKAWVLDQFRRDR